eukprot:5874486-Prymnesium_polylepis.1
MRAQSTRRRGARWRHAPRVGKWAQADVDVRTSGARAWGPCHGMHGAWGVTGGCWAGCGWSRG